jgi:hypothetical protein
MFSEVAEYRYTAPRCTLTPRDHGFPMIMYGGLCCSSQLRCVAFRNVLVRHQQC